MKNVNSLHAVAAAAHAADVADSRW